MLYKVTKHTPIEVVEQLTEFERQGWITRIASSKKPKGEPYAPQLDDSDLLIDDTTSIEGRFVTRLQAIARRIAGELNGKTIRHCPKGHAHDYKFYFDDEKFCEMMSQLLLEHYSLISNYLGDTKNPEAVKFVAPFLGSVLNRHIFNDQRMEKTDLRSPLAHFYGNSTSAVKKLSVSNRISDAAERLFLKAYHVSLRCKPR